MVERTLGCCIVNTTGEHPPTCSTCALVCTHSYSDGRHARLHDSVLMSVLICASHTMQCGCAQSLTSCRHMQGCETMSKCENACIYTPKNTCACAMTQYDIRHWSHQAGCAFIHSCAHTVKKSMSVGLRASLAIHTGRDADCVTILQSICGSRSRLASTIKYNQ